jgi:hypothetical protein
VSLWVSVPRIRLKTLYKLVCVYWSHKLFCVLLGDADCVVLCIIVGTE